MKGARLFSDFTYPAPVCACSLNRRQSHLYVARITKNDASVGLCPTEIKSCPQRIFSLIQGPKTKIIRRRRYCSSAVLNVRPRRKGVTNTMNDLFISDTTLREGEQAAGVSFNLDEKRAIAAMLDELGVDEIECGTPAMGPAEREAAGRIASMGLAARIISWNRAHEADIKASMESGLRAVAVCLPVSDLHIRKKLAKSRPWVLRRIEETVNFAKEQGLYVCFGAEDASRAEERFLVQAALTAKRAGADRLRVSDTVGVWEPFGAADLAQRVKNETDMTIEVHCHNDFGLAVGNALAAVRAGAAFVSASVLGLGDRAGVTPLEELIMALRHVVGMDVSLNVQTLPRLCRFVAQASGRPIPSGKPIVGAAAFRHEAGIHVDGVLKNPRTYELFPPEELGLTREIVLGKHSGRAAVRGRLQKLGIVRDAHEVERILVRVRAAGMIGKRSITDDELMCMSQTTQGN